MFTQKNKIKKYPFSNKIYIFFLEIEGGIVIYLTILIISKPFFFFYKT